MAAKTKIRPEAKQINPARGRRWRHRRFGIEGVVVEVIPSNDRVIVDIPDDLGMMTWKSTAPMFLERWNYVGESR